MTSTVPDGHLLGHARPPCCRAKRTIRFRLAAYVATPAVIPCALRYRSLTDSLTRVAVPSVLFPERVDVIEVAPDARDSATEQRARARPIVSRELTDELLVRGERR